VSLVSLVKIKSETEIKEGIQEALDLIQYSWSTSIENVVIKPNLCYYWDYTTGQTTNPKFTAKLIELIREKVSPNVNISIVESDASAMKCKYVFKMLGYEKLAENYNVKLVNLSRDQSETTEVVAGKQSFTLMIPATIQKADLKINVPKIKYMMEPVKLSCALKNIFGCNPYPKKYRYHSCIEKAIVAINKVMKFDLHIVDGIIVSGTHPCKLGLIMASTDPVAIDTAAADIAGINPNTVKYLQLAKNEGLGNNTYIPKGIPISQIIREYPRRNIKDKLRNNAYKLLIRVGLSKRLE
jgi:uncharacterized protein (DUF362 family)